MLIIDTPQNTSKKIPELLTHDVGVVVRYYNFSNSSKLPEKRLELAEAQQLSASNIKIAVVFQQKQDSASAFSETTGMSAGRRAYRYAKDEIGQPQGSGIYFAVDYDADENEIKTNIIPYFNGIKRAFHEEGETNPEFKIGAYGSGLVCTSLQHAGLIDYTWLSMSTGFRGTKQALKNKTYHLAQQAPEGKLAGLGVDFNLANPDNADFGQFFVAQDTSPHSEHISQLPRYKVIARRGLILRGGPGTQFDKLDLLKLNQVVFVTDINDGWGKIDTEGDGHIDGFSSMHFLEKL